MTREQRFKYEMLVRVRDYGTAHKDHLPESSSGEERFAQVSTAVAAIDDHLNARIVAAADARGVKAATRAAVFEYMKAIALAARRVTEPESRASRFRLPRRRSLKVEVSTARVFLAEARARQDAFVSYGLPATFISEFQALVNTLQGAIDTRLSSKTQRGHARQGIVTELARGFRAVRDLDAIVSIGTRHDPIRLAAWQSARRIEGQSAAITRVKALATDALVASPVPSAVDPPAKIDAPASPQPVLVTSDALEKAS